MVDWCKWIWPPKSYPSPCTHRVSAPYTSQKIHWHYCGQFVNLSRGIFDFQGAEFGSTWNPSWRSEINRVETTTSNSCCGLKLAPYHNQQSRCVTISRVIRKNHLVYYAGALEASGPICIFAPWDWARQAECGTWPVPWNNSGQTIDFTIQFWLGKGLRSH